MNVLYEPLPESVVVGGNSYRVKTDFRNWLKLIDLVHDNTIDEVSKSYLYKEWYADLPPENENDLLSGLIDFLTMKGLQEVKNKKGASDAKQRQTLSYSIDAPFIVSAFLECYGINLFDQSLKMHWWQFRILLDGLPDHTEIQKRRSYRSIDLSQIRNKKERERIKKIQSQIALPQREMSDFEIGCAF